MISHRNICGLSSAIKEKIGFTEDDIHISYLPMPHVMEKSFFNGSIYYGYKIGVFSGNILKLLEDI